MKHVSQIRLFVCAMTTIQVLAGLGTIAADELVRRGDHSYLTYSDANIARLKERVRNEPAIADAWERMLAIANRTIVQPAGERGRRGRGRGRDNEVLCLAYRMTGDKKFGERVKRNLLTQNLGGRNDSMLLLRDPPWNSGLGSGAACESFGIAFDSVYDLLTRKERTMLAGRPGGRRQLARAQ